MADPKIQLLGSAGFRNGVCFGPNCINDFLLPYSPLPQ
jgi:hypothetical protein